MFVGRGICWYYEKIKHFILIYYFLFSVHWKHLAIQHHVPKAMAGIGNGVDLDCSTVPRLLADSYCLSLHTLSFCKRINQLLKIPPVGKGNTKFQTGWWCIHWGSQSVNNHKCRTRIITSCVCRSAAVFLPPAEFWWFVWKFAYWVGEWLMKRPFCYLSLPCWRPFSASSEPQLQPNPAVPVFVLQLSDISPIGRDPSVSSFSSATLTPSSTCPSLVDSRCNSVDQK